MAKTKVVKGKTVKFQLQAPEASAVMLAGDFNNWDYTSTKLQKGKDKVWKTNLTLKPGRYEYKFVVDGNWMSDPANPNNNWNPYGTENSVLEVE